MGLTGRKRESQAGDLLEYSTIEPHIGNANKFQQACQEDLGSRDKSYRDPVRCGEDRTTLSSPQRPATAR